MEEKTPRTPPEQSHFMVPGNWASRWFGRRRSRRANQAGSVVAPLSPERSVSSNYLMSFMRQMGRLARVAERRQVRSSDPANMKQEAKIAADVGRRSLRSVLLGKRSRSNRR